jgi:Fic family protein
MELNELLEQVDQLKAAIDALRPIDAAQERRIMQKFRLDWTFHSNAIEGNQLTYGETKAFLLHGITAQGKPFRDYLDIKGHHAAIDFLLAFVRREEPLSEADVRELHKVILVEPYQVEARTPDGQPTKRTIQPGQYKTMPNHVETSTGEIHYYATPEETPAKMADLMAWYRREVAKDELHPLILAATFHYQFVMIHPFDDGNGRMARLLMNLIFLQAGYPPVITRTEDKNNYLLALEQADTGDLEPFIVHIGNELINSLNLFLRGAKGEDIEEIGDFDKKVALLNKRIEAHEAEKENRKATQEEQRKIVLNNFLYPFFSRISMQLLKIDPFFEKSFWVVEEKNRNIRFSTGEKSERLTEYLSTFLERSTPLQVFYEWERFRIDTDFNLSLMFAIVLRDSEFELICQINSEQLFSVLKDEYEKKYSLEQLDRVIGKITSEVIKKIEQMDKW